MYDFLWRPCHAFIPQHPGEFTKTFENHFIELALVNVGWDLGKAEASFTLLFVPLFNCRTAQEEPREHFNVDLKCLR